MSNLVQSEAKRGISTSHALQWSGQPVIVLAALMFLPISQSVAAIPFFGTESQLASIVFGHRDNQGGCVDALNDTPQLRTGGNNYQYEPVTVTMTIRKIGMIMQ